MEPPPIALATGSSVLQLKPDFAVLDSDQGDVIARLQRRLGWAGAAFNVLGKFPELQGVLGYWAGRLSGKRRRLIEYK